MTEQTLTLAPPQLGGRSLHPRWVHTNRGELVLLGLLTELVDVIGGGFGLQGGVVDVFGEVERNLGGFTMKRHPVCPVYDDLADTFRGVATDRPDWPACS